MSKGSKSSYISSFIKEVCKGKNEKELTEAEDNFRDYLLVIKGICDRLEREGKSLSDFDPGDNI